MKRFLAIAGAALLVGAGAAWSSAGEDGPSQDRVAGGGIFGPGCSDGVPFCIGAARSFSIDAASSPEGGGAYGTYFSGRQGGGVTAIAGRVTCLRVDGDSAVAGGYRVGVPAGTPDVFFIYMQDRGTAGAAVGDRSSATFGDFSTSPDLPAGFPRECPPVDNNAFDSGYFTLTGGDVQIVDAK
jgi:hypothetical protein